MSDLINWQEAYSIGVEHLDVQHHDIVTKINRLYALIGNAKKAEAQLLITSLIDSLEQHFEDEESLMLALGYPSVGGHMTSHKLFLTDMRTHEKELNAGINVLPRVLLQAVSWFNNHTVGEDQRLARFIKDVRQTSADQLSAALDRSK